MAGIRGDVISINTTVEIIDPNGARRYKLNLGK